MIATGDLPRFRRWEEPGKMESPRGTESRRPCRRACRRRPSPASWCARCRTDITIGVHVAVIPLRSFGCGARTLGVAARGARAAAGDAGGRISALRFAGAERQSRGGISQRLERNRICRRPERGDRTRCSQFRWRTNQSLGNRHS
jgi:hypothetical protein